MKKVHIAVACVSTIIGVQSHVQAGTPQGITSNATICSPKASGDASKLGLAANGITNTSGSYDVTVVCPVPAPYGMLQSIEVTALDRGAGTKRVAATVSLSDEVGNLYFTQTLKTGGQMSFSQYIIFNLSADLAQWSNAIVEVFIPRKSTSGAAIGTSTVNMVASWGQSW